MNQAAFTEALGEIWENTPAIAQQSWQNRLFTDITALHQSMVKVVQQMSPAEQLALIQAHPDLGSKTKMAQASVQEQSQVGLNTLSSAEYQQFQSLNQAYQDKFGFPFIIAVKNHTKTSILAAFKRRLQNSLDAEKQQALTEISQIARFRLEAIVS
ncbi:MAG: 2-oxo-4-hydroxy-4-carboxy-5-ureidoimidazoline decarboxylase [Jaaginema sp. PMC 1079.18]|nr:2-oxo-4-hydroxy-4-carboxy-5-ureidoimidazoline decarboxylase [Jaaginema sp. PMC 1080.18]MEC4849458.1 2-oxo-4-hydroxy-4-carboxy-5-ureidoimidazoline decarboxylase [Jaaginema sp. PMC 1079.18]MEC4865443.1 2-oxo-4-hydroxy-4-carboxy-5-ureidoimidazoline decarboxylase [Jaaginema sp. PMC 1078.18]